MESTTKNGGIRKIGKIEQKGCDSITSAFVFSAGVNLLFMNNMHLITKLNCLIK